MDKDQLLRGIGNLANEEFALKEEKNNLEKEVVDLEEFHSLCMVEKEKYENSLQVRKNKLNGINDLGNTMRSAFRYMGEMRTVLEGKDYQNANNSIENLLSGIIAEKSRIIEKIENINDNIRGLAYEIQDMMEECNRLDKEKLDE